ncbi:glycosyltransferase family 39 protein [Aureispira anguillae]|uniref:Glycosyltransferase family 39 protein n=1 Tax=Aureispira anguillae TaxID=2864201 RepID=A0A916DRN3_9BACT|nr:glycosyltransferase family 39 protein [Aureispira anguillae]BDS10316.1 glycosyltransferase family 39 protein [Aureispira anguillae]
MRLYTFLGIIAFLFIHHYGGYFGHYGFDDIMGYGYYGKKWADGELFFLNEDFFSYRWGFISLTGFFYALFGVNDEVSAIAPSLVLLATVLLIFRVLKQQPKQVAVIAAAIYVLDNWTMYYSDKLMPDTSVALATFAAFSLIGNHRFDQKGAQSFKHALLLSMVLIWAYITKQSVLLLFPVFFLVMLLDIFQKRYLKFWIYTTLCCIAMGVLYLLLIYGLTGDPLARFHAVEAGLDDNLGAGRSFSFCNYAIQPWSVLWYRIGYEMIYKFMATGMMISLMLALPAIFSQSFKRFIRFETPAAYWSLILVLSLLSSNFMTTSYKAYLPICPDIRHFLFLVPMAAVVAAPLVYAFAKEAKHRYAFIAATTLVFVLSKWSAIGNLEWCYAAIMVLVLIRAILPNRNSITWGFLLGIALAALAPIVSSMQTANKHSYVEQRAVIYKYFKEKPHKSIVVTNVIQKHFGQYLMEYNEKGPVQFYDYSDIPTLTFSPETTVYVLANGATRYMSNFDYNDLPRCIKDCYEGKRPPSIQALYETSEVALYQLNQPNLLKGVE